MAVPAVVAVVVAVFGLQEAVQMGVGLVGVADVDPPPVAAPGVLAVDQIAKRTSARCNASARKIGFSAMRPIIRGVFRVASSNASRLSSEGDGDPLGRDREGA